MGDTSRAPIPHAPPIRRPAGDSSSLGVNHHYPQNDSRRLGWLLGIAAALAVHGLVFFGDLLWHAPSSPRIKRPPEEVVIQMEMPPLEPDKVDEVVDLTEAAAEKQMAPPTLPDLPTVVALSAFVQPLQPPPPPGIEVGQTMLSIPVGRPGSGFGHGIRDLFDINNLDQRPVLKVAMPPDYPYQLRQYNVTGNVTVEFIIDTGGNVLTARVLRSTNEAFELPAIRAVEKWKFRPGRKSGRVVNTRVQQIINFNLEKD